MKREPCAIQEGQSCLVGGRGGIRKKGEGKEWTYMGLSSLNDRLEGRNRVPRRGRLGVDDSVAGVLESRTIDLLEG